MLGREFAGRWKKTALLGAAKTAGGGGRILLLLGLSGGLRWISGCLVKVFGGLNWAVKVCVESWLAG